MTSPLFAHSVLGSEALTDDLDVSDSFKLNMATDALTPNDPRVQHKFTTIGDLTYHYMLAKPEGTPVATAVLIHGWYVCLRLNSFCLVSL